MWNSGWWPRCEKFNFRSGPHALNIRLKSKRLTLSHELPSFLQNASCLNFHDQITVMSHRSFCPLNMTHYGLSHHMKWQKKYAQQLTWAPAIFRFFSPSLRSTPSSISYNEQVSFTVPFQYSRIEFGSRNLLTSWEKVTESSLDPPGQFTSPDLSAVVQMFSRNEGQINPISMLHSKWWSKVLLLLLSEKSLNQHVVEDGKVSHTWSPIFAGKSHKKRSELSSRQGGNGFGGRKNTTGNDSTIHLKRKENGFGFSEKDQGSELLDYLLP